MIFLSRAASHSAFAYLRMMIFPEDVHAIDKPASEADHWVAIADWIQKYLEL